MYRRWKVFSINTISISNLKIRVVGSHYYTVNVSFDKSYFNYVAKSLRIWCSFPGGECVFIIIISIAEPKILGVGSHFQTVSVRLYRSYFYFISKAPRGCGSCQTVTVSFL